MTATPQSRTTCAFPTSPMTASTPRPTTAAPGFRCRNCTGWRARGGSAKSRRASSARRPTAATASPSKPTRRKSWRAAAPTGVDAAVLVPNCPVCHQTISLVARHLEANGISTVVMGCAKDIVEHAAVPRFLFSDFPLGNSAGKPHDRGLAGVHAGAGAARAGNRAGSADHGAVAAALERGCCLEARLQQCRRLSAEELARRRREFDAQKEIARGIRESAA